MLDRRELTNLVVGRKTGLEEMVASAFNDAIRRVEEYHKSKLTSSLEECLSLRFKIPFFK